MYAFVKIGDHTILVDELKPGTSDMNQRVTVTDGWTGEAHHKSGFTESEAATILRDFLQHDEPGEEFTKHFQFAAP